MQSKATDYSKTIYTIQTSMTLPIFFHKTLTFCYLTMLEPLKKCDILRQQIAIGAILQSVDLYSHINKINMNTCIGYRELLWHNNFTVPILQVV